MTPLDALRRHRLVWPNPAGRAALAAQAVDTPARACLARWQAIDAPFVVTRQPPDLPANEIAVGLPAPSPWNRRRWALRVAATEIDRWGDFPRAVAIDRLLAGGVRGAWRRLAAAFDALGAAVKVYGSYGWQASTGESYLHASSDLDLLLDAADAPAADAIVRLLDGADARLPRLDGELVFPDGGAVAWREWRSYRAGAAGKVLVKRLNAVALESPDAPLRSGARMSA